MRFALKTAPQATTWTAMLDVWRAADDIELFESAWNFDHFEPILGKPRDGDCLEGWTMLAAMAQATRRIRVGVMVTGIPYRHPAVLANQIATVDVISNGRLEVGLGAGWNTDEADAYGISLGATLTERFDRFDEACQVIIGLLTEPRFSFAGEHYTLKDAYCSPKGVQLPHPPITIGGDGERRTLRAVARYANRWNTPFADAAHIIRKREVIERHCADIGRDPAEIDITSQVIHTEPAATAEFCAQLGEAGVGLAVIYLPESQHRPEVLEPLAEALAPLANPS
jgi:F420-dependent oxidoreductase-like protein